MVFLKYLVNILATKDYDVIVISVYKKTVPIKRPKQYTQFQNIFILIQTSQMKGCIIVTLEYNVM